MKQLSNKDLMQLLIISIACFTVALCTGCTKAEPLPPCATKKTATVMLTNTSEQIMYVYINGTRQNLLLAKATHHYPVPATVNKICLVNYNTLQSKCATVSVVSCEIFEFSL